MSTGQTLAWIYGERLAQGLKWGEQNHPSVVVPRGATLDEMTPERWAKWYGVASPGAAKRACEARFRRGDGAWMDILVEEVSEILEAKTPAEMRAELIQVAAVAVAWIECLDRERDNTAALLTKAWDEEGQG